MFTLSLGDAEAILGRKRYQRCAISSIIFRQTWSGKPSSLDNLKVFNCVPYEHVKQDKLPRAKKCVFLRYLEGVKGYRLLSMESDRAKVIISRDVVFDKRKYYKDLLGGEPVIKAPPKDKRVTWRSQTRRMMPC